MHPTGDTGVKLVCSCINNMMLSWFEVLTEEEEVLKNLVFLKLGAAITVIGDSSTFAIKSSPV